MEEPPTERDLKEEKEEDKNKKPINDLNGFLVSKRAVDGIYQNNATIVNSGGIPIIQGTS